MLKNLKNPLDYIIKVDREPKLLCKRRREKRNCNSEFEKQREIIV